MLTILLYRFLFQLGEQFIAGTTLVFSALFFGKYLWNAVFRQMKIDILTVIVYIYFLSTMLISFVYGSSFGSVLASYNKLFLCLIIVDFLGNRSNSISSLRISWMFLFSLYSACAYVLVGLLIPSNYITEWGVKSYILCFKMQHLTATFIVLLIVLVYFDIKRRDGSRFTSRLSLILALMYALAMTGARTFTVCGAVFVGVIMWDCLSQAGRRFRLFSICGIGASVLYYIARNADTLVFFEKNNSLAGDSSSFSNGRDEIWGHYGMMFMNGTWGERLFGRGTGLFEDPDALAVGTHNDFLFFGLSFGLVGLVLYLVYVFRSLLRGGISLGSIAASGTFAFASFSNGFSGYTEYVLATLLLLRCFEISRDQGAHAESQAREILH